MAVVRHYLRDAQTVSGTGGTIYDLSTTVGTSATLTSAAVSATGFTNVFEFRVGIGSERPEASIPYSVEITAVSSEQLEYRWRFVQIRSGSVIADTAYSTADNTTGTKTGTLSFSGATWASGDFLALEVELRRNGGGGSRDITLGVNRTTSYADPDLVLAAVVGSLAAQEAGADTFTATGAVAVAGTLVVQETGDDTFSASGTVFNSNIGIFDTGIFDSGIFDTEEAGAGEVTGTLAAQEAGADTFTASGTVAVTGTLAAQETGDDTFAATETVAVTGSLAAVEAGDDTFAGAGTVAVTGSFVSQETGDDVFAATGTVAVTGSLAAQETGDDTFSATGSVFDPGIAIIGTLVAQEAGSDLAVITGRPLGTIIHAFNDNEFVEGELRRWDGAQWAPALVRRWDGGQWAVQP